MKSEYWSAFKAKIDEIRHESMYIDRYSIPLDMILSFAASEKFHQALELLCEKAVKFDHEGQNHDWIDHVQLNKIASRLWEAAKILIDARIAEG